MSIRLVTLASFPSPIEAALARNVLVEAGIRAETTDDATTWAWGGMFGSVKLLVDEADLERAGQLLDEVLGESLVAEDEPPEHENDEEPGSDFAENLPDRSPAAHEPAWTCSACNARVAERERRCWSCGASTSGEPNPYFVRGHLAATPAHDIQRERAEVPQHVVDIVDRAWRATCLGFIVFPFAHLYSGWLLFQVADYAGHFTGRTRRRFYFAFALDVLIVGLAILLIASMIRP